MMQAQVRARSRKTEIFGAPKSELKELGEFALAGFAGYAGGRLISRVTYVQASKKWPKAARHLSVGSGLVSVAGAYYLLGKVKKAEPYVVPIAVGAAIAALQTVVQTYVPKFGWIVSDYQPLVGSASTGAQAAAQLDTRMPATPVEVSDDDDDDDTISLDPMAPSLGSLAGPTMRDPGEKFSVMAGDDDGDDEFLSN